MKIEDHLPVSALVRGPLKFIQDFLAPFYLFTHSRYKLTYVKLDDYFSAPEISLSSEVYVDISLQSTRKLSFTIHFNVDMLDKFSIFEDQKPPSEWTRTLEP
jgi:hypothetical protein